MRTRTADALIGLLVLGAILTIIVAIVVTRGWTERRITLYMLSPTVQDLKQDTPVYLQGLLIGEVASISPQVGDSSRMGPPQFLVALRLRERYANGAPIRLPIGTRGQISSSGLIGAASIALAVPKDVYGSALEPEDTIPGDVTQGWSEGLKEVVDSLKTQVSDILRETRSLLSTLDRTANSAQTELAATAPELRATLTSARQVLERMGPMIESTDSRMGTLHDSLTSLLADTRRLVNDADTLTNAVTRVTGDLAPDLKKTITNMYVVSAKLEHFVDQVSRRPHRLLTGVHQPPRDSILETSQ